MKKIILAVVAIVILGLLGAGFLWASDFFKQVVAVSDESLYGQTNGNMLVTRGFAAKLQRAFSKDQDFFKQHHLGPHSQDTLWLSRTLGDGTTEFTYVQENPDGDFRLRTEVYRDNHKIASSAGSTLPAEGAVMPLVEVNKFIDEKFFDKKELVHEKYIILERVKDLNTED
ncbi:MAG TPA: hypothetical protein PKC98_20265 [Candidatus Melainabacteria bacterium]|nr:hypothetical protein [Candidatus Melainabacteria bacterium]